MADRVDPSARVYASALHRAAQDAGRVHDVDALRSAGWRGERHPQAAVTEQLEPVFDAHCERVDVVGRDEVGAQLANERGAVGERVGCRLAAVGGVAVVVGVQGGARTAVGEGCRHPATRLIGQGRARGGAGSRRLRGFGRVPRRKPQSRATDRHHTRQQREHGTADVARRPGPSRQAHEPGARGAAASRRR